MSLYFIKNGLSRFLSKVIVLKRLLMRFDKFINKSRFKKKLGLNIFNVITKDIEFAKMLN